MIPSSPWGDELVQIIQVSDPTPVHDRAVRRRAQLLKQVPVAVLPMVGLDLVGDHEAAASRAIKAARDVEHLWLADVQPDGLQIAVRRHRSARPLEIARVNHDPTRTGQQRVRQGRVVAHRSRALQLGIAAHDVVEVGGQPVRAVLIGPLWFVRRDECDGLL